MAIFRPQEAASWLELHAMINNKPYPMSQLLRRGYLRLRDKIVSDHGIKCCGLPHSNGVRRSE